MSLRLELRRDINGTGLAVFVVGKFNSVRIPLAQGLSEEIEKMLKMESIQLLDAPNIRMKKLGGGT